MFITLEGMEGSGKTTLAQSLLAKFIAQGHEVLITREPGGCNLGSALRQILLNPNTHLSSTAELFLFLADRAQHVAEVIQPALDKGQIVICDRYIDSTIVYQGYGRGLSLDTLQQLNSLATNNLWPDCTLILDLPVIQGLQRAKSRQPTLTDRFESEQQAFHEKIRQGFLLWAKTTNSNPPRLFIVDASQDPEQVLHHAWDIIEACYARFV